MNIKHFQAEVAVGNDILLNRLLLAKLNLKPVKKICHEYCEQCSKCRAGKEMS
jgi:hypothetical protein